MTDTNHIEVLREIRRVYIDPETIAALDAAITALSARASAGEGVPKLQRYFPAKPSHPGWEMSPHDDGEWVLWQDVAKWWSAGPFAVSKFEGVGHDAHMPITYSVKGGGMNFNCGTYSDGERNAQWLAARLNTAAPQPAQAGASGGGDTAEALKWVRRQIEVARAAVSSTIDSGRMRDHYAAHEALKQLRAIESSLTTPASPATAQINTEALRGMFRALVDAGGATTVARHGVERGSVEWAHAVTVGMLAIERYLHPERFELDDFPPGTAAAPQPQEAPAQEWRCFHCDEAFTDRDAAAIHFGTHEYQRPACLIDAAEYRRMEAQEARYAEEDADCHRAMHRQASEHQVALRRAEEAGYAKGLRDSGKCPCATPPAHGDGEGAFASVAASKPCPACGSYGPCEDVQRCMNTAITTNFRGETFAEARQQLVNVLKAQKSWVTGYAESYVDEFADMAATRPTPEAHADTKRLDFLLDNCAVVKTSDGHHWRVEYEWLPEGTEGPFAATKRAAIDAALALPAQGEG